MLSSIHTNRSNTKGLMPDQVKIIWLLSIGTFLEYFDLMLYIHMASYLNSIFFPKTDPFVGKILAAFTFSVSFVVRPVGALIFGYIGDVFGRRYTIIITTFLMAMTCFCMAGLPTYDQVGIAASIAMIMCRISQGISSMGEIMGALIYLTEFIPVPERYRAVGYVNVGCSLGGLFALCVANFANHSYYGWRVAFLFGAAIAVIGSIARTTLRETPDFADAQKRVKQSIKEFGLAARKNHSVLNTKISFTTVIFLILINLGWPFCFTFVYHNCSGILKDHCGYSDTSVMIHNLIPSIFQVLVYIVIANLSIRFAPIKIVKVRTLIFIILIPCIPYVFNVTTNGFVVLIFQLGLLAFAMSLMPAEPTFAINIPIFKRFSVYSLSFAISRTIMYPISTFLPPLLYKVFGTYTSLVLLFIPIYICFFSAVLYFEKLEKKRVAEH